MRDFTKPVVVIGGGFYGCNIAESVAKSGANVVLIEKEAQLMTRSSYNNQARLHSGYHYPRSFGTGYRSRLNFTRFINDFRPAIVNDFLMLYAIARVNSRVTARQFEAFCSNIDAPIRPVNPKYTGLFSTRLIETVYETQEYAFDAMVLRDIMAERLTASGVKVMRCTTVSEVCNDGRNNLVALMSNGKSIVSSYIFNCTYSALNTVNGIPRTRLKLKHEIAELALVELPPALSRIAVTVIDGPFFSIVPFPDRNLCSLTHVRYTPHAAWIENSEVITHPDDLFLDFQRESVFRFMVRDAQRYMPCLQDMIHRESLFEVKTLLTMNENDDGRPILFDWSVKEPRIVSVLGSKIDNVYDALTAVELHLNAN